MGNLTHIFELNSQHFEKEHVGASADDIGVIIYSFPALLQNGVEYHTTTTDSYRSKQTCMVHMVYSELAAGGGAVSVSYYHEITTLLLVRFRGVPTRVALVAAFHNQHADPLPGGGRRPAGEKQSIAKRETLASQLPLIKSTKYVAEIQSVQAFLGRVMVASWRGTIQAVIPDSADNAMGLLYQRK